MALQALRHPGYLCAHQVGGVRNKPYLKHSTPNSLTEAVNPCERHADCIAGKIIYKNFDKRAIINATF